MINRFIILICILLLSSCEYHNIDFKTEPVNSKIDYMIFGHMGSFCLNCDALYKIENGKLYGANHQLIQELDKVNLVQFPDDKYEIVRTLPSEIPNQLLTGQSTNIGSYAPDAGHFYIEISQNHVKHHWYIEERNTPTYLTNFLSDLRNGMTSLN